MRVRVRVHAQVAPNGVVLQVCSVCSPKSLFGFDPRALKGRSIVEVVDVLDQEEASVSEVMDLMVGRCVFWGVVVVEGRRGVHARCATRLCTAFMP